jgi:hypothetical protein
MNGANAGITVYYVAPYDGSNVTAFLPVGVWSIAIQCIP